MAGLRYLDIRDNKLSGVVPREFSRLELDTLYAAGSGVCVPSSLGEWFDAVEQTDSAARCVASIAIQVVDLSSLKFHAAGETGDLSATYVSAEGDTAREVTAAWSSGDTAVVSVSAAGRVTAVGSGETEITATYDSITGTIAAVVDLPENDRDVLEILYDRARGDGWTDATNWLTDEPLSEWAGVETDDSGRVVKLSLRDNNVRGPLHSSIGLLDRMVTLDLSRNWISGSIPAEVGDWYGVTVDADDFLVRRLDLPDNGLEGLLPPVIANLTELESLDLADNGLEEGIPAALTTMDALDTIRVSGNEDMDGPLPYRMVDMEDLRALQYKGTGLCASPAPTFQQWIDELDVADGSTCDNPDSVRLSLPVVYLNQAIQRTEGYVPLISNREALLRVFLVGDQENAFYEPEVIATFTRDGEEVHRVVIPSDQDRVPTSADESSLLWSYDTVIPARHIVEGTEFVIVADSGEVIPRAEGSRTRFPETGSHALDVAEVPPFELTVVPVLYADAPDSSIFEWTDSIDDDSHHVGLLRHSFPVGKFTAISWDTAYVTSLDMTEEDNTWPVLLEVEMVYKSAESTGYWYAVADSDEGFVRGVALLNGLVSFGKPWDTELAHEVGHTLDLLHAPCGGATGTDPDFPYSDGSIGVWGYDFRDGSLVSPERRRDIMGYCYDKGWLSDYYFERVIRVRENKVEDWTAEDLSGAGPEAEMLVLWGGVLNGELRIEPVHSMQTTPKLPAGGGEYRIEGFGRGGQTEFSLSFTPGEDQYGNKYFFFTIPIEGNWEGSLERITLTGPEGEVTVDRNDPRSLTIVTDPATGRIRAILRDWNQALPAALGDTSGLEVVTTRGIVEAVRAL